MKKLTTTSTKTNLYHYISRIFITFFLIPILSFNSLATDYYFSSVSGNDSRTALQATNPSTPWKSIDKLNSFSNNLKAGDRILFKAGESFYGTIKLTKSGAAGSPIIFTSYGTGEKPIITSMVTLGNLYGIGNGLYQANLSSYGLSAIQIALVNNQVKEIGRYPNSDAANGGYLKIASLQNSTTFSSQSSNPITGSVGEVVVRKNNWIIDRHKIYYISGTYVSYLQNGSSYPLQANFGYFLQNHINLLDQPGEWSFDPDSKLFTINLNGYNFSNTTVAVSTLDNLVTNNPYVTNIQFNNLHFKGSNASIFEISKSNNITLQNNLIEFAGENAISGADIQGLIIENNQIISSLNNGVFLKYGTPGVIIKNNRIDQVMKFNGMGKSSDLAGIGIYVSGDSNNALIEGNNLTNIGFNGIHFGGNYSKIINNYIDTFCLHKQDGGGIYSNSDGLVGKNNTGREINGNIILNGIGRRFGTTEEVDMSEGIYLDDNAAGIKISNNTIAKMSAKGIYLHNVNNIEVSNNLFYRSKSQLQFTHDYYANPNRNITVYGNQFSNIYDDEKIYSAYSVLNDLNQMGNMYSNYFLDPFDNDFFIHSRSSTDPAEGINRNLGNWQSNFGYDQGAIKPDFDISTTEVISSSLIKKSDFSSGNTIFAGIYNANSSLNSSGISGNTFVINPTSNASATAYIQLGSVWSGEKIMVDFDLKGSINDIPIEWFLENTYNLDKGEGNILVATKTSPTHYRIFLDVKATSTNESMVIRIPSNSSQVFFDNIEISKVSTKETPKENFIFFQYNASSSAIQVPLSGTYKNAKNEIFIGSVSIPANRSVLLAKISDEGASTTNQPPTIQLTNPIQGQVFSIGSEIVRLSANASDPEGQIKQVDFYNWGVLINTSTTAPYTFDWSAIEIGNYQVYAKVTDANNLTANSETINFSVRDNISSNSASPKMSSPANNSQFTLGEESIILKTNALETGISVQKVEYFNWGYSTVTVTASPFEFDWTTIKPDIYKVFAKITDTNGNTYTTDEVVFTVVQNNAPLIVSMSNPYNGQTFIKGSDQVILKANVSNTSKVASIQYYNWGYPLVTVNSYPFEFDWSRIEVDNYKVHAEVTDTNGNITKSAPVLFKVTSASARTTETDSVTNQGITEIDSSELTSLNKDQLDPSTGFGIKMGPNPSSGKLTVFFEDYPADLQGTLKILDIRSIELYSNEINTSDKSVSLDISNYRPGVYIVMIEFTEKGIIQTKKLIKH